MGDVPSLARILIVDDRPENLQALRAILEDQPGYELVDAATSEAALRELLRHDFCVVLLDAFLPGMDGFEIARLMKEREKTRDVPIIFLTAAGPDEDLLRRAYHLGAVDYLVKPVAPELVRAKVAVFADLARKSAQITEQAERLQEAERREQAIELAELKVASERRYRQLAESIPQIVGRMVPDGQFEYWNHRWYEYTGSEAANDKPWSHIHPDDRERSLVEWQKSLKETSPFESEVRIRRRDGVYRWHLVRAVAERNKEGELVAWLGTATDIDDRKRADDERIELLVRERASRFEAEASQKRAAELYVEAREAVRLRDDFLTVAAHELRTPLTTLRLQAQQLARAQENETSRSLLRSVERLCRLVDQLLDVSKLAGGRVPLQMERIDLLTVVREAAGRLDEEAGRNGCKIHVGDQGPLLADVDPLRIDQVVTNLLSNAIKYGRGKPIEIDVRRDGVRARMRISDHGIGVPHEESARIFERFARAVSVREYGGLGLGLFISKQIVEAHGGEIRVESEPGAGATFVVDLPLTHPAQRGVEVH